MHMKGWYKGVLITWLMLELPAIIAAIGFAGGNPFRDLDFRYYTFVDFVVWLIGWFLAAAPIWLAPFGLRVEGRQNSGRQDTP